MAELYSSLVDSYDENSVYSTEASVVKCKAFIVACRRLKRFATRSSESGRESEFSPEFLTQELANAESWLAANDTDNQVYGRTVFPDFEGIRG
jgi:hypothetical protein